jgi:hypothetical protein
MDGFIDALKPAPFTDANFKRWQMRDTLWLTVMNVFWISEGSLRGSLPLKRRRPIQKTTQSFVVW